LTIEDIADIQKTPPKRRQLDKEGNMDLKKRIEQFKKVEYETNKDFYREMTSGQQPHTLFIGCSDSRVHAETLFQARAGELFQIRNVANLVPRAEDADAHPSVVAAIKYAVKTLQVKTIMVCGHSNCGGCAAIRKQTEHMEYLPYTRDWISQSSFLSDQIDNKYPDMKEEDKLVMLEKLNALRQLDNLMTYEFVRQRVESRKLKLQACYYDIGTGNISVYDFDEIPSGSIDGVYKIADGN
jgi:carbonic anhydrase